MEAIKETTHVKNCRLSLTLPKSFDDLDVEVFVWPVSGSPRKRSSEQVGFSSVAINTADFSFDREEANER